MIQFNLLPDVKQEYIKTQRTKNLVVSVATIAAAAALTILVLLYLTVGIAQKKHINDLTNDIKDNVTKLQNTPDLDKVLTVQNQLNSLTCTAKESSQSDKPCLHDKKPVVSRIFTYLSQLTPTKLTISNLTLDYAANTINITGDANALSTVNKFVDTLKFTNYHYQLPPEQGGGTQKGQAFSSVVLASFSLSQGEDNGKGATYQVNASFDPAIFDSTKDINSKDKIKLDVPKKTTTRSEVDKPTEIFDKSNNKTTEQGQ